MQNSAGLKILHGTFHRVLSNTLQIRHIHWLFWYSKKHISSLRRYSEGDDLLTEWLIEWRTDRLTYLGGDVDSPHSPDAIEIGLGEVREQMPVEGLGEYDALVTGSEQSPVFHVARLRDVDEDQVFRHVQDRIKPEERGVDDCEKH